MVIHDILYAIIRSTFAFFALIVLTRFRGRKAILQMTISDFAVSITMGSVAAMLAIGNRHEFYIIATILVNFALLSVLIDVVHIKSIRFRKAIDSEPVMLIQNGEINNENMKKIRLAVDDLTAILRQKNIFNMADVEFALMEYDGKISVLPKSQKQPLTPSDLNISTPYKGLTKDIIIDGVVMEENLKDVKLDHMWLRNQLSNHGVTKIEKVFYAGLDTEGNLYVSIKKDRTEKHGQYGIE